jgi:hypothetical protein
MHEATLCEVCGQEAIARVRHEWLCARCGLHRTTVAAGLDPLNADATAGPAGRWRGAFKAAIGSGLAAKVLIGAAALAAVGGAVATDAPPPTSPPPSRPPVSTPAGPPETAVPGTLPDVASDVARTAPHPDRIGPDPVQTQDQGQGTQNAGGMSTEAAKYVAAIHVWSECLDRQVRAFSALRRGDRSGFDPFESTLDSLEPCGRPPSPAK